MTLEQLASVWDIGVDAAAMATKVGSHRLQAIAQAQGTTPLATWTLDMTFCGVLHPPEFFVDPVAHAPREEVLAVMSDV